MTDSAVVTPPKTVFVIYIRAPRERVWQALTETGATRDWLYGTVTQSDWRPGGTYSQGADGFTMIDGEVLEVEEPSHLRIGFDAHWDDDVEQEPAGVLDYLLEEAGEDEADQGAVTRLTVTLSGLQGATAAAVDRDTPRIYSSLKSSLETGEGF